MAKAPSPSRRWSMSALLIAPIRWYQLYISPMRPASCRFEPTCSQYAIDALREFGLLRGSYLAVVRLLKCGPWHRGGWDPIPDRQPVGRSACAEPTGLADLGAAEKTSLISKLRSA